MSNFVEQMSLLESNTNTEPKLKRARQNESESESESEGKEGNEDRLSELPDPLVIHILSFLNCKDAVQTCILSRRWKGLWKHLPSLILRSSDFRTDEIFSKSVPRVLSLRDSSIALHTLDFQHPLVWEPRLLERVVSYAISHHVQHLGIYASFDVGHLPHSIFSCQTLTSLKLAVPIEGRTPLPKSLNLPQLKSLHLHHFAFCASDNDQAEPFSGCKRLNDLVIKHCTLSDAKDLCVSSTTLSSLAISTRCSHFYEIMRYRGLYFYEIVLSTPSLRSFAFEGARLPNLSGSNLSSVEEVHIDSNILSRDSKSPTILLDWLKGLTSVLSLTVSANNLQVTEWHGFFFF